MSKRHALVVDAPPERVWEAVQGGDFASSGLGKWLMALRGYGSRTSQSRGPGGFAKRVERFGFVRLGETPGREVVFGLAGRFWRPDGGLRRLARADFLTFAEEGSVKAASNLQVRDRGPRESELSTETRLVCFGAAARRKFRLYWFWIEPFSGLTRRGLLRGIARRARGKPA